MGDERSKRITRILTLLFKIWEQQPDLRFNQLVQNLQALYSQQNNNFGKRNFYEKDGEITYPELLYRFILLGG